MKNKKNYLGFTLIELMVAILIFGIIAQISYRTITSLLITKKSLTDSQQKWWVISRAINKMSMNIDKAIPLAVRDNSGVIVPAMIGVQKLSGLNDSQIEFTIAGYVGDEQYGSSPPKRVGFRYDGGNLYYVTWPYMNRVNTTTPQINLLLANVSSFDVEFLYDDKNWHNTWPSGPDKLTVLPKGVRISLTMNSGEHIVRQWAL